MSTDIAQSLNTYAAVLQRIAGNKPDDILVFIAEQLIAASEELQWTTEQCAWGTADEDELPIAI